MKEIKEASSFEIAGDAGRGYVMLSALTETALARKFKHPKGLECHYTFRTGAVGKDNSEIQIKVLLLGERSVMGVHNGAVLRIRGVVCNQEHLGWSAGALISCSIRAVFGKSRKRRSRKRSPDGPPVLPDPSSVFVSILPQWNWKRLSTPPAEYRRVTIWLS